MKKIIYTITMSFLGVLAFAQGGGDSKSININTEFIEFAPTVSGDGKTMVFQSNRDGKGFKLYEATMQDDGIWSAPVVLNIVNNIAKPNLIGGPCLSQNGKILYFCAMTQDSDTDMDIFVSRKTSITVWSLPVNIGAPVNTKDSETFPSISPDGKKLFYTLTTTRGKDTKCTKIMMSEQDAKNNWKKPVEVVAPINGSCDKSPRMAYDNKTLFFSSNKNGNYDLFRSEFSVNNNTWSQPIALDYVNSSEAELSASLIASEDFMYYSQKGDVYVTRVPDNFKLHGLALEGKFLDVETGKPLSGKIFLIDTLAKDTVQQLNVNGYYKLSVTAGKKYKLSATADGYNSYNKKYAPSTDENFNAIVEDIKLSIRKKEVLFKISDKENSKGLKVKIKVTNVATKEETIVEANAGRDGKYAVSLREGNKYNVEISSIEGYAFNNTTIDVPLTSDAETIYTSDSTARDTTKVSDVIVPNFEIKLEPLKDNTKLTLNDIHFLFNKFQLEEESYKELEKVIDLMKSNPSAQIEISAHTDDVGSDDFNNNLSSKRAQEIVKYLSSRGISSSRLKAKGYGKTRPIDPAPTEEARAKNRRVELKILDIK